jgi:hypothetical protein
MDNMILGESDVRPGASSGHVDTEDDEVQDVGYRLVGHSAIIQGIHFSRQISCDFDIEKMLIILQHIFYSGLDLSLLKAFFN